MEDERNSDFVMGQSQFLRQQSARHIKKKRWPMPHEVIGLRKATSHKADEKAEKKEDEKVEVKEATERKEGETQEKREEKSPVAAEPTAVTNATPNQSMQ